MEKSLHKKMVCKWNAFGPGGMGCPCCRMTGRKAPSLRGTSRIQRRRVRQEMASLRVQGASQD